MSSRREKRKRNTRRQNSRPVHAGFGRNNPKKEVHMSTPVKISKDVTLCTRSQIKKARLRLKLVEGEMATIKAETSEIKIRKTKQRIKIKKGWV
jgi:hypothetical protein